MKSGIARGFWSKREHLKMYRGHGLLVERSSSALKRDFLVDVLPRLESTDQMTRDAGSIKGGDVFCPEPLDIKSVTSRSTHQHCKEGCGCALRRRRGYHIVNSHDRCNCCVRARQLRLLVSRSSTLSHLPRPHLNSCNYL